MRESFRWNRGYSLVELMLALAIGLAVVGYMYNFIIKLYSFKTKQDKLVLATTEAAVALRAWVTDVRLAGFLVKKDSNIFSCSSDGLYFKRAEILPAAKVLAVSDNRVQVYCLKTVDFTEVAFEGDTNHGYSVSGSCSKGSTVWLTLGSSPPQDVVGLYMYKVKPIYYTFEDGALKRRVGDSSYQVFLNNVASGRFYCSDAYVKLKVGVKAERGVVNYEVGAFARNIKLGESG